MQKPVLTIFYQMDPISVSIGGIQTTILNFLKYAPQDFEVRLVGIGSSNICKIGKWNNIQIAEKEIQFLPLFYIEDDNIRQFVPTTLKYALALFLKNYDSDFLHFHRIEPSLATFRWSGIKTLFIHADVKKQVEGDGSSNTMLWRYMPSAYFMLERLLMKQFSNVLSCNSESLRYYQSCYSTEASKFQLIRNTVDNEVFFPLPAQEMEDEKLKFSQSMQLSNHTRFIVFAGRLHPQKDPLLLVRAFANINEPNIHLLMVGEGELKSEIESEIQALNVSDKVTLLGGLKAIEVAGIMRIAELLVLTSVYEGLPMVVLEALACGIPIVTTKAGETPLLISQETGVVIEERTPKAVAETLNTVLTNPKQFSSQACIQMSQPYWAKTVISEVYGEMRRQWQDKRRKTQNIYSKA